MRLRVIKWLVRVLIPAYHVKRLPVHRPKAAKEQVGEVETTFVSGFASVAKELNLKEGI